VATSTRLPYQQPSPEKFVRPNGERSTAWCEAVYLGLCGEVVGGGGLVNGLGFSLGRTFGIPVGKGWKPSN